MFQIRVIVFSVHSYHTPGTLTAANKPSLLLQVSLAVGILIKQIINL